MTDCGGGGVSLHVPLLFFFFFGYTVKFQTTIEALCVSGRKRKEMLKQEYFSTNTFC